ncbi:MAG: hypothetical protein ACKOQ2_09210 [Dolichospermum sp.]
MINQVIHGDCFDVLMNIPDGSIDAVITDPPYKYLNHKLESDWDEKAFLPIALECLKKTVCCASLELKKAILGGMLLQWI